MTSRVAAALDSVANSACFRATCAEVGTLELLWTAVVSSNPPPSTLHVLCAHHCLHQGRVSAGSH